MGRHSHPDATGPNTEPSRWGGLRQRVHDGERTAPAPADSDDRSNVLTRPVDETQIIPRIAAPVTAPAVSAPPTAPSPTFEPFQPAVDDATAVFARPVLDPVAVDGALTADPPTAAGPVAVEPVTVEPATVEPVTVEPVTNGAAALDDEPPRWPDAVQESSTSHQRLMWPALVVFWLLALGAGIITLASLGAPHYICTGAAKGLACHRAGTVIAAVLTVLVIAAVGVVSVFAIEARRRGLVWLRYLGIGVVVLAVMAGGGYLLIRTIGG